MAGRGNRVYEVINCYSYREGYRHPYPVLKLKLYNIAFEEYGDIELQIDTGFEGSILVPREIYEFFAIGELPRSLWRAYKTFTGMITFRTARAYIELRGKKVEVFIESPAYGYGLNKSIIGREILNKLTIILDGKSTEACIGEDQ
jgi:clan AA aspartic protease